jgi:uncharacterized protein YrzB (UPF0473 family)
MPLSHNGSSAADEPPVIYTTDEEGVEHRFQMIDMIEVEGQLYGLLLYLGDEEEKDAEGYDEEVVVMRIVEEDGEQVFEAIEDEDEFEKVVAFVEQMEEDEDDLEDEE